MSNKPSKPFSNGTEYLDFQYQFCERCTRYKEREDGFPEVVDKGGCQILDAMEYARFDITRFPSKLVRELASADDGSPIAWHYCTYFHSSDSDLMFKYFMLMKKAICKTKEADE